MSLTMKYTKLHMAQLMPLPLTVSCFSKIQIGFTFLVPAHLGSPGKGPLNGCVCVFRLFTFSDLYWVCLSVFSCTVLFVSISQVIGCEDRLLNDLYCVEWGVKLLQPTLAVLDPRVGLTMDELSIYLCHSDCQWLTLPRGVLSTSWCCPSRPCMVFLACVHLHCSLHYLFLQATPLIVSYGVTSFLALTVSTVRAVIGFLKT